MANRRELYFACSVQKVIWSKKPEYLFEKLTWIKDIHNRSTRAATLNLLALPNLRTVGARGCFKYQASKIWNDLPPPMREQISLPIFKSKYKNKLLLTQKLGENLKQPFKITHKVKWFARDGYQL